MKVTNINFKNKLYGIGCHRLVALMFIHNKKKKYTDVLHNSQPKILGTYERGILL